MATLLDDTLITDTLLSLPGWQGDASKLWREVHLPPELDAELRRQISVDAGVMHHPAAVEPIEGGTRYTLSSSEEGGVTELDIMLASHISDLVHRLSASEPGIHAQRDDAPEVDFKA